MGMTPAPHDATQPTPASTTEEMLAALPEGLMVPAGASSAERRAMDVLALYRAVFQNSTEAIAIIDSSGYYLEQNAAHQLLLGYRDDELRGKTPAIHMGDEAFATIVLELTKFGVCRRELLSRTKDGRARVIDLSAFAVRDRAGHPVCYVGIERDVTEHRESEAELERAFRELQVIYRLSNSLGHAVALETIYEQAITGLVEATRADRASVLVFDAHDVMRFKAWHRLSDGYRAAVEGHSPWTRDTKNPEPVTVADVRADAHLAALAPTIIAEGIHALAFIPLVDDSGNLLGKFMLYFDVPHSWSSDEVQLATTIARHVSFAVARHHHVAALRASVTEQERLFAEAHEANRTKSIFLATMSHELRTPLNAIAGYTDLLDAGVHGELTLAQRDAVQRVQANQRHLLRLIDDVLDFAKLEAGHLHFEISNVPVQETLDGACVLVEPQLRAKGIDFQRVPGDALATCRGDRAKVQQILANLLSNAWKFTPTGGAVQLSWKATAERVEMHVRDSGPGIASEHLETIFEPFVQLQMGFRRKAEGTGLGLAISRELARAMGGDLTVSSVVGKGSTFTLVLARK